MMELTSSATHTMIKAVKEAQEAERNKMGREFASGYEAWAKIKRLLETVKADMKTVDSLQDDVWKAIKEDNEEAVNINLNALSNRVLEVCVTAVRIAAEAQRAAEELRDGF